MLQYLQRAKVFRPHRIEAPFLHIRTNEPGDKMSPAPKITSYDVIFEYFQRKNHKVPPKLKL